MSSYNKSWVYVLPFDADARLCGADRRAGALVREGLVEHGVRLAAVDDVDARHALFDGLHAAVDLRDHAAGDRALVLERLDILDVQIADDIADLDVVAQALDIGEDHELFSAQRGSELARGGIAVDVEGVALTVGADGGNDGDVARVEHGEDGLGIDIVDVAHVAVDLVALVAVIDVTADAGKTDRLAAELVDKADELGVHLADEHHLDNTHDVGGGVAQALDELDGDVELFEHLVDAGAAAVAEHGLHAEELEQHHVVHDGVLELFVDHGVAAVLDDNDLTLILLKVRHCLHQSFDLVCDIAHGGASFKN